MADGGKGSAPRKERNDQAYRDNWGLIFGKEQRQAEQEEKNRMARAALDAMTPCFCENRGACAHPFCSCGVTK